jgi:hypothetical protein
VFAFASAALLIWTFCRIIRLWRGIWNIRHRCLRWRCRGCGRRILAAWGKLGDGGNSDPPKLPARVSIVPNRPRARESVSCLYIARPAQPGESTHHGVCTPSLCGDRPRNAHARDTERGDCSSHPMGKSSLAKAYWPGRSNTFHCTDGTTHEPDYLLAHVGNSAVGEFLSLEVLFRLGVRFLLFGKQLFNCGK